jgi:hypothetical protein
MANGDPSQGREEKPSKRIPIKKTYVKPAFRFERVFETQALSCGKIAGQGGACNRGGGKSS